jgi:histidyl-tRNA synthetase
MANPYKNVSGTRDFGPSEMAKRNFIIQAIRNHFHRFGYQQIETPAMEGLQTLLGKYGEEGDKLIFKILNSGDFLSKVSPDLQAKPDAQQWLPKISEKALRYDLTVPFARFVVQNQSQLTFPFKRYQIQPVWRADRPQKGRFREFYQCDADVVGSKSLTQEAELIGLYARVFEDLRLPVTIRVNHRQLLGAISAYIGETEKNLIIINALDKLDKIGEAGVFNMLKEAGVSEVALKRLQPLLSLKGSFTEKIDTLTGLLKGIPEGESSLADLKSAFHFAELAGTNMACVDLDITLARGLNYYTGAIFEVVVNDLDLGSVGGGGRYDDLTGIFGLPNLSGIGISFGLDRIYLAMESLDLFPSQSNESIQVLFLNFGDVATEAAFKLLHKLRDSGLRADLYPDAQKIKKQFDYANKIGVPYVVIIGADEVNKRTAQVKHMQTGHQEEISWDMLVGFFLSGLGAN